MNVKNVLTDEVVEMKEVNGWNVGEGREGRKYKQGVSVVRSRLRDTVMYVEINRKKWRNEY